MTATVETYRLKAALTGKHVGVFPMVTLECGFVAKWIDRMSKREAIRQTERAHQRDGHACGGRGR